MEEFKVMQDEVVNNVGQESANNLPANPSLWTRFKGFMLQDITVELTPRQQEFENKLNDFLHQEITFKSVHDFLFQEIKFGK